MAENSDSDRFTESIPLDVAEALFDVANTGEFAVYSTVLDAFPPIAIPSEFKVLGSAVINQTLRVGLATTLDTEQALTTLAEQFAAEGWIELPYHDPFARRAGFVYGKLAKPRYRRVCHDKHGQVSINFRKTGAGSVVVLNFHLQARKQKRSCAEALEQERRHQMMHQQEFGAAAHMPVLTVPDPSESIPFSPRWMLGGYSERGHKAESEGQIEIDWPIAKVYSHFAEQLAEQEWVKDAESVGEVSANGTWIKTDESEGKVIGTLSVVNVDGEEFDLKFVVELTGGGGGTAGIVRFT